MRLYNTLEVSNLALMSVDPLVSVVMLAFNHEPYISEAIESVVTQDCEFPFELIIAEDFSSDQTLSVAHSYQLKFPNLIRVISSSSNVGIYENYNRALQACRGRWVAFCEGDDYWTDKKKLSVQVANIERFPCVDISFHSCFIRRGHSSHLSGPAHRVSSKTRIVGTGAVLMGGGPYMPTASILVRAETLRSMPLWMSESDGALDVYIQAYGARRGGALYIDRPMSVYRREVSGSWTSIIADNYEKYREFWVRRINIIIGMANDFPDHRKNLSSLVAKELIGVVDRGVACNDPDVTEYASKVRGLIYADLSAVDKVKLNIAIGSPNRRVFLWASRGISRLRGRLHRLAVRLGIF